MELAGDVEAGEMQITIDYGQNLIGTHGEIENAWVNVGDHVTRGQEIGIGMSYSSEQSSAEFWLFDKGRTDGVSLGQMGIAVSPFDYLESSEKQALVAAYRENVLEKYASGLYEKPQDISINLNPYQPYLTNELFLHRTKLGKLDGEWYMTTKWEPGYPNDVLTFVTADNPYYKDNVVLGADDEGVPSGSTIDGYFEADYDNGRVKITDTRVLFITASLKSTIPRAAQN